MHFHSTVLTESAVAVGHSMFRSHAPGSACLCVCMCMVRATELGRATMEVLPLDSVTSSKSEISLLVL